MSVKFYLPHGLWLVNKDKCIVEIKDTQEVKVSITASCTTLYGMKKLKVITPRIIDKDEDFGFWSGYNLQTIWVGTVFLFLFY